METERKSNEEMREEVDAKLEQFKRIGSDSQEKLGMVKDFIDKVEKRFRVEIESLEERLEKIIKIQEKQELDSISPMKLDRRRKRG